MGTEQDPLASNPPKEDKRSSSEIKSDIRQTRNRLDDTLEDLNERLSPRSLINDILSWFESRGAHQIGSGTAGFRNAIRRVKENPMPALLIGAGIVWWMLGEDKDDSEQFGDQVSHAPDDLPVPGSPGAGEVGLAYEQSEKGSFTSIAKDKAGQAKEALSSTAEAVTEKMSNISSSAHAAASSAANVANEGVRRTQRAGRDATEHLQKGYVYAGDRFQEAVEEYPLAVALGFLGVGILTGLLLPRTQQEDKLLGEKSDQLIEHVKEAGKETLEKAKTVAEPVADPTVDEAERQGITPAAAGDKISDMAKKIRAAATQAKEETLRAAEEEQLKPRARTEGSEQSGEQTGA